MRTALIVVALLARTAAGAPTPPELAVRAERTRAELKRIGLGTDTKVEWDGHKNGVLGSTDGEIIHLNQDVVRSRSQLTETMAHEMKHVRDRPLTKIWRDRIHELLDENQALLAENPSSLDRVKANRQIIDRLLARTSSNDNEGRAFRVGAFAKGRLGQSLGTTHLTLPNHPEYADRDHLVWANVDGYVLGAKVSLLRSDRFRALAPEARLVARQRVDAYLRGYADFLTAQAKAAYAPNPDPTFAAPPLSVRVDGLRRQPTETLTTSEDLEHAGARDAQRGLPPQGRGPELLQSR